MKEFYKVTLRIINASLDVEVEKYKTVGVCEPGVKKMMEQKEKLGLKISDVKVN